MQGNDENIHAMQTQRYQNICRRIHFHRSRIHELRFEDPLNLDVQEEIQYNRLLEETLWHHFDMEQQNEARRAATEHLNSARNSSLTRSADANLRVLQAAGIFGSSKPPWDEKIASKNYTDFEHRGTAFTQFSNFEDGFIRSPDGKKLTAVRIVKVDTSTKMATILQSNATLVAMFDAPSEIEASKVLYRCTRDPRSVLLSSEVIAELQKREEYMSFDDIVEGIKQPTKYFKNEDPWMFEGEGLVEGQLVDNFLCEFAENATTHKFCKTIFNVAAKKPINSLEDAAKQIPNVSLESISVKVRNKKVTYMGVRVHAKTDKEGEFYAVEPDNANWKYLVFHITDTSWNKPGPKDLAKVAAKAVEVAAQRAHNKITHDEKTARENAEQKGQAEERKFRKSEKDAKRKHDKYWGKR